MTNTQAHVAHTILLAAVILAVHPAAAEPPPEPPRDRDVGATSGMSQAAHPPDDPDAERRAVDAAHAGTPVEPVAASPRLRDAIERLLRKDAPFGEIFALIKMTDRKTGERQIFTRGAPDPSFSRYLDEPGLAPDGFLYVEQSELWADGGVETAIRSQLAIPATRDDPEPLDSEGSIDPSDDEQELSRLREINADSPFPIHIDTDLREHLESLDPDSLTNEAAAPVHVAIDLRNVPDVSIPKVADIAAGGHLWAGLELASARERAIAERKLLVKQLQDPLVRAVEDLGGRVHYASWLAGTVEAHLSPKAILSLAKHEDVLRMEKMPDHRTDDVYGGIDVHDATHQSAFKYHQGYNSAGGHFYTSRLTIGMAEECIRENYPAWRNNTPSSSFRARFYDIDPSGHTLGSVEDCWAWGDGSDYEHGHWVAAMMVADFMDGQDPSLSTNQRRFRTGSCPECYLVFFQDQNLNNRIEALDRACDKGVDIFQSSISSKAQSCDGSGPYDGAIQSLTKSCGVLYVQSAGNEGSRSGSCTTTYPGDHPWTLTVAGVQTETPCDDDKDWFSSACPSDPNSSRGGAKYNGDANRASVVDLAAPYRVWTLDPDEVNPLDIDTVGGTSFSSPIVAGLAGRMMDFWRAHADTSVFHANRMKTLMMLFGDRSGGTSGISRTSNDTSRWWGTGRVVLFPFDARNGWWLRRGSVWLKRKRSFSFDQTLPSGARMVKVVVWHDGKNYANEPKIKLELDPGGGCSAPKTTIEESDSKAMQFRRVDGCETVHVRIRNSPVGLSGSRRFHYALIATRDTSERAW